MDPFDRASEQERMSRESYIAEAIKRRVKKPDPTGLCLSNCGEEVDPPRLFCGVECAERFEWIMRRKR